MNEKQPVFSVRGVSCTMPSEQGERVIFNKLSLDINTHEIVDLTGPSGSGKSSLLTAFAKLNPHAHGEFMLDGRPDSEFTPQQWRSQVAYLPQKSILPGVTVADAIRLPWTLHVRSAQNTAKRSLFACNDAQTGIDDGSIRHMLDSIGCEDIELNRDPHDLSGGQAARVSLARTLLTKPRVLLADEVDAGLDDDNADLVAQIMQHAAEQGMAIIRIRHRASDGRATRTLILRDGILCEEQGEQA